MPKRIIKPWHWPNLLSIDAPTIAVLWQEVIALSWNVNLTISERMTIFIATWTIYLADRLFDTKQNTFPTARHQFVSTFGYWLLVPIGGLFVIGSSLAIIKIPHTLLHAALPLVIACCLYIVWAQLSNKGTRSNLTKSVLVGSLFSAGIMLAPHALSLSPPPFEISTWFALSGLLIANHLEISRQEESLSHHQRSAAASIFLGSVTAGYCILILVLFNAPISFAIVATSCWFLVVVTKFASHCHPENSSFLADATLWLPPAIYLSLRSL